MVMTLWGEDMGIYLDCYKKSLTGRQRIGYSEGRYIVRAVTHM
jgi:hypothetical protein